MSVLFTCEPSRPVARRANRAVHERLRERLQMTLVRLERATGRTLLDVRETTNRLFDDAPLSPDLYAIQAGLEIALATLDRDELIRLLKVLLSMGSDDEVKDSLLVRSFGGKEADRLVAAFVAGPTGLGRIGRSGPLMYPVPNVAFAACRQDAEAALTLIARLEPALLGEAEEHVRWITLFRGKGVVGASTLKAYGSIYIRAAQPATEERPLAHYVEHIVHESAHMHLNALMHLDPLVVNAQDQRFPSPLRTDPRPMHGIYHATFVLARIVRVFERWFHEKEDPTIRIKIVTLLKKLEDGLGVILEHGKLTDAGCCLLDSLTQVFRTTRDGIV